MKYLVINLSMSLPPIRSSPEMGAISRHPKKTIMMRQGHNLSIVCLIVGHARPSAVNSRSLSEKRR